MLKITIYIVLLISSFTAGLSQGQKGGSYFYETVRTLSFEERERAILHQFSLGNFPDFLLDFIPVDMRLFDSEGEERTVTIYVSPDYLSIGNRSDYFIIPMGPITAQRIADSLGASLPTSKVVDIIYKHSKLKLEPFNFIPRGSRNETMDIMYDHSKIIQAQIKASGNRPGVFVAGTKKDIIISSKLNDTTRTHHVTIYGWHKLDGTPIQPVSNIHVNTYVDYSHGVRLILNKIMIDGKEYNYKDVLTDKVLYKLLSDEDLSAVFLK